MPCYKGIAVSIHWNGTPLAEYGIQKQSRFSRISSYIPVPQPELLPASNTPEPAKFAVSITLLTPNLPVPYSTPELTDLNRFPRPLLAGSMAAALSQQGQNSNIISPYIPMTNSEHETIAAYIYFDGRAKEEVATLLRPGEETWVNSRWVQVADSEGGGLAEREFLFREVGLERWLNGLDLQGDVATERLERRRQKFERRGRRTATAACLDGTTEATTHLDISRSGNESTSPPEGGDAVCSISFSDEDDDEPPAATGQIKVTMFRVLASGEIKRGEYSPQFAAHEDDEELGRGIEAESAAIDADVEHTTSFAKPKSLDPTSISTQTVTGIDGPGSPYATFTFFYRSERQLQKIGVMASSKPSAMAPSAAKRSSAQFDFTKLGPLNPSGTVGFSAFRDQGGEASRRRKNRKEAGRLDAAFGDESEDEDEAGCRILKHMQDLDDKDMPAQAGKDDARTQGELAEGLGRIKLKRAYSAEPDAATPMPIPDAVGPADGTSSEPQGQPSDNIPIPAPREMNRNLHQAAIVGSPLKKPRPFFDGSDQTTVSLGASFVDGIVSTVDHTLSPILPHLIPAIPAEAVSVPVAVPTETEADDM